MSEGNGTFAESALAAMLELLDEGALLFEGEALVCLSASKRAGELLGVPPDLLVGRARSELISAVAAEGPAALPALAGLLGAANGETVRAAIALAGEPPRIVDWASAPLLRDGRTIGRIDVLVDRTHQRQLEQALEIAREKMASISLVDELTGLANRRHFENEIDREHRRSQRAWSSYAIARIDIDGMAALNAELGHGMGDRLLRRLGEELKSARREYDLVARWEQDELIVLLPGIDGPSVKAVLSRSIAAMRDVAGELTGRDVTFCTGVALWIPPSVETANDIVARAGTALQAAQLMGAGTTEIDASSVEWKDEPPRSESGS